MTEASVSLSRAMEARQWHLRAHRLADEDGGVMLKKSVSCSLLCITLDTTLAIII